MSIVHLSEPPAQHDPKRHTTTSASYFKSFGIAWLLYSARQVYGANLPNMTSYATLPTANDLATQQRRTPTSLQAPWGDSYYLAIDQMDCDVNNWQAQAIRHMYAAIKKTSKIRAPIADQPPAPPISRLLPCTTFSDQDQVKTTNKQPPLLEHVEKMFTWDLYDALRTQRTLRFEFEADYTKLSQIKVFSAFRHCGYSLPLKFIPTNLALLQDNSPSLFTFNSFQQPQSSRMLIADNTTRRWVFRSSTNPKKSVELISPVLFTQERSIVAYMIKCMPHVHGLVDQSTGFHIHLDATYLPLGKLIRFIDLIAQYEPAFYSMGNHHPYLRRIYAKPLNLKVYQALRSTLSNQTWLKLPFYIAQQTIETKQSEEPSTAFHQLIRRLSAMQDKHQSGLNLDHAFQSDTPKATIELRYFDGVLSPLGAQAYVDLALQTMRHALATPMATQRFNRSNKALASCAETKAFLRLINLGPTNFPSSWTYLTQRSCASSNPYFDLLFRPDIEGWIFSIIMFKMKLVVLSAIWNHLDLNTIRHLAVSTLIGRMIRR